MVCNWSKRTISTSSGLRLLRNSNISPFEDIRPYPVESIVRWTRTLRYIVSSFIF